MFDEILMLYNEFILNSSHIKYNYYIIDDRCCKFILFLNKNSSDIFCQHQIIVYIHDHVQILHVLLLINLGVTINIKSNTPYFINV